MHWLHFGESNFYEALTTSAAFLNICEQQGWRHTRFNVYTTNLDKLEPDESVTLLTFHAAYPKIFRFTVQRLRGLYPNARVVSLGSDSIAYLYGYPPQKMLTHRCYEFNSPEDVDLHLDLLSEVVEAYRDRGINAANWMWTASSSLLKTLKRDYQPVPFSQKTIPFYSLIAIKSIYREKLREILSDGIIGPNEPNLPKVYQDYTQSKLIVGTTSGSWTPQRTMKGFRDWIAPALGSVLVYDNHPDVIEQFGDVVPVYNYYRPQEVRDLLASFDEDSYNKQLELQQRWIQQNTIENQFLSIITTFNLCESSMGTPSTPS